MVALSLNTQNKLIDIHLISLGILDASLIHPREVFRNAIMDSAWGVVIAHNHPSGNLTPSPEDVRITKQLVDAGKIIGIKVLDHVIVAKQDDGRNNFFSLRESGMVDFTFTH
jgi:DNA repair protein RadC